MLKIYHNSRCSKSRQTLAILQEKGVEFEIVDYLNELLSVAELRKLAQLLQIKPRDFVRTGEAIFKELNLDLDDDDKVLQAIVNHPKLLERPIVVADKNAVIGRPPENVLKLL